MSVARVAHLTSVHPRIDTRIFLKQCRGLASSGYDVSLVVADGLGDERKDGVAILDVGKSSGRLGRILGSTRRVFQKAVELDADIYHLHDPELIPVGLRLKRRGKTVVYDSHEDVPKQLLAKPYLGPRRLQLLAHVFSRFERFACSRFDGIVTATPTIGDKFRSINKRAVVVNNFPFVNELHSSESWDRKEKMICYVGGVSAARGIREMVDAMGQVKSSIRLALAGSFSEQDIETEVRSMPGWDRVDALGFVDRSHVRRLLSQSIAGLVTLHPTPNHMDSHPIKMFEYMSAGIPVIASDFPLWRTFVEESECGYCVDALDPTAIAKKIDKLAASPDDARRLGENGRKAVLERFNWPNEERKLLEFYSTILTGPSPL